MREVVAMAKASWLAAASYRINMLFSLGGLLATVVPLYFVAGAIQPIVADSIKTEGGQYFAFLLVGMIATSFLFECSRHPSRRDQLHDRLGNSGDHAQAHRHGFRR